MPEPLHPSSFRLHPSGVGVDIGGTFTDFVVAEGDAFRIYKVPSTPHDPSEAFLRGLEELELGTPQRYVHGSTVATNAVLERRGARAAFLTSEGFRDMLELGRQTRLQLYSLTPTKHLPLIPRGLCFEVPERVDRNGDVLVPLDLAAVEEALDRIVAAGAESLAVTFLFSFLRPEHERMVGERARARGLSVSLSCEVLPEYREYERASTTAANAYVAPLMDRYLGRLQERLVARDGAAFQHLQIMQSNGGVISVETARREAVRTVLSGPAGGVIGAWKLAAGAGHSRLITFDMGGTSTDVALVDGSPVVSSEGSISDLPIRIPMLEIHTVGAGGGSLARREAGGTLRVGPESAGADPGPAAYGKGDRPTVTDANLALGRIVPEAFLGGRMSLDADRSWSALASLGRELRLSPEQTALGIMRIANAQMARAIRRVSVERGHDPRLFCLVAFGGGGPLHACELAEETGIPVVLVPRYPGILSALGMLLSDIRKDYSRTVMAPVAGDLLELEHGFAELEARAGREMAEEGVTSDRLTLERWLDLRYRGQSYELSLRAPELQPEAIMRDLRAAHERRYGYAPEGGAGEIVHLRIRATGTVKEPYLPHAAVSGEPVPPPQSQQRVFHSGDWLECPVWEREQLAPGHRIAGPAVITQADTTFWLPPGWDACVDGWYNVMALRGSGEANRASSCPASSGAGGPTKMARNDAGV